VCSCRGTQSPADPPLRPLRAPDAGPTVEAQPNTAYPVLLEAPYKRHGLDRRVFSRSGILSLLHTHFITFSYTLNRHLPPLATMFTKLFVTLTLVIMAAQVSAGEL
jgi:hypothetical protein